MMIQINYKLKLSFKNIVENRKYDWNIINHEVWNNRYSSNIIESEILLKIWINIKNMITYII